MEQLRRIAWLPVLWGVITDVFLTQIVGLAIGSAVGISADMDPATSDALLKASSLYWPTLLLGILFSGVGGYVAGRLAKREGAFHGTLAAFLSNIAFTLLAGSFPDDMVSTVTLMACILAGTVGGWLASLSYKETV